MRIPSSVVVAGALVLAVPFGWGLGVFAAYAIAGRDFGQLPVLTVPLCIVGSIAFASWPTVKASTRFKFMLAGTLLFIALAWFSA